MAILAWIILIWVFACCIATFGWCVFVEICRWQQRRNLSGSGRASSSWNPNDAATHTPEPDQIVLTVVRATGTPLPKERDASHPSLSLSPLGRSVQPGADQTRATVRHLHVP